MLHVRMRRKLTTKWRSDASWGSTHWSMVGPAIDVTSPQWKDQYGRLYLRYFAPCFAWLRLTGCGRERAKDLVQDFWCAGLDGRWLRDYDRTRGRFSTYLRLLLSRWRDKDHRKWRRQPDRRTISLSEKDTGFIRKEVLRIEERLPDLQAVSPEKVHDREWALQVIRAGFASMKSRLAAERNKGDLYIFKRWIRVDPEDRPAISGLLPTVGLSRKMFLQRVHRLEERIDLEVRAELRNFLAPGQTLDELIADLYRAVQVGGRVSWKRTAEDDVSRHMSGGDDGGR